MKPMFFVDAAVGSGKTRAMIESIVQDDTQRNYLIASRTIELLTQTAGDLRASLADAGRARCVLEAHTGNTLPSEGSVRAAALSAINARTGRHGTVVFVTTDTCLEVMPDIKAKSDWVLVMDESFDPVEFSKYTLGDDPERRRVEADYLTSVFDIDETSGLLTVRAGEAERVQRMATGRAGDYLLGLRSVAALVRKPGTLVHVMAPGDIQALQDNKRPLSREIGVAAIILPDEFRKFDAVIFLAALFEDTMLPILWRGVYGVEFQRHEGIVSKLNPGRNTHVTQASNLYFGHLLHPEDRATRTNLERSFETAEESAEAGSRVIDWCIRATEKFFEDIKAGRGTTEPPWLLQMNRRYTDKNSPEGAPWRLIPTVAHGLNAFQDSHDIAALAVTNLSTPQLRWLRDLIPGLENDAAMRAWRVPTIYQAIGRCSLRDMGSDEPKFVVVLSKDDAEYMHRTFEGSELLGQINGADGRALRRLAMPPRQSKPDWVSVRVVEFFAGLPSDTTCVKNAELTAHLRACEESDRASAAPQLDSPLTASDRSRGIATALSREIGWHRPGKAYRYERC
ncbi:hypothetical protein MAFF241647_15910 [Ralstonia solanacearum]|nr:hypothetical protein MAFF241647_15910 [Ralstonia solanacearum]